MSIKTQAVSQGYCDPLNYSLGLAWFTAGIFIDERFTKLWSILGISGVAYFVVREIFEGFCQYCTLLHVIGLIAIASFHRPLKTLHDGHPTRS